jgi:hypothetical protein
MDFACPTVKFVSESVALNPPSIGIYTRQGEPLNPDGTLPRPWVDLKGYEGDFVEESVIKAEKDTYYFLFKMYDTFYAFATDTKVDRQLINPLAAGWGPQRVHWRNASTVGGQWRETPFSLVTQKGGHVLVVVRGTMYRDEWRANSVFHLTKHGETDDYFPGRVHTGAFRLFKTMLPFWLEDIRGRNPTKITVLGHSLGGVISTMLGAYFGRREGEGGRAGGVEVEVLTVGAYATGDRTFWEAAKGGMNVRNLKFLGEGWTEGGEEGERRKMYTMGDVAAQAPGVPLPNCFVLEAPGEEEEGGMVDGRPNEFFMAPGTVPIWPGMLRNAEAWRGKTDMLDPRQMAIFLCHKCSYTCWLTEGVRDPESRCFFPEQQQEGQQEGQQQQQGWWAGVMKRIRRKGEGGRGVGRALGEGEICRRAEMDADADYNPGRDPRIRGSVGGQ